MHNQPEAPSAAQFAARCCSESGKYGLTLLPVVWFMHRSMTDINVIIWVALYQYIPTSVATRLVYNVATLQQNVLAAAPVFQRSAPPCTQS